MTSRFAHATQDLELTDMEIRHGHVAAMDVNWNGVKGGRDVVSVRQRWLASSRVEPGWTVEHGYLVEVEGDPNLRLRLDIWPTEDDLANLTRATMHSIGMRITTVPVVNAIPAVCAAAPGLLNLHGACRSSPHPCRIEVPGAGAIAHVPPIASATAAPSTPTPGARKRPIVMIDATTISQVTSSTNAGPTTPPNRMIGATEPTTNPMAAAIQP